jgi:hypothetical protein
MALLNQNSFNPCISNINEQCEGTLSIYILKPFQWCFRAQINVCLPFQLML